MNDSPPAAATPEDARLYAAPRAPAQLLIRGAHVVDPRAGIDAILDVLVRDGVIAELGGAGGGTSLPTPAGATVVDGERRHLFPAFVDPHVHLRTPGQEYKETIATGTAAAAAGGYGAVVAMPNTSPTVDTAAVLESLRARAGAEARVPTGFLAAITRDLAGTELTEMAELRDAGALGFTDDGKPVVSAGMLRKALQYQRLAGGIIALHEEDPALSGAGVMHEGAVSARLGVTGIPSLSESTMVARDAALARYESARVHFQHLSCVESVQALAAAREHDRETGTRTVSGEASPHHLTLTDDAVQGLDSRAKMNPPLRAERDRQALVAALRDGVIECVATDHAPHARHEKEVAFEEAPMGTTGLETAFAALYTELVLPGLIALDTLVHRMTEGGALYGLTPPRIAPGAPANLALVDLTAPWTVGEEGYASASENCCFHGRRLHGRVLLTVAAGAVAHQRPMLVPSVEAVPR